MTEMSPDFRAGRRGLAAHWPSAGHGRGHENEEREIEAKMENEAGNNVAGAVKSSGEV